MFPATFEYVRASGVDEAIEYLQASDGEAKLLAGGHSLLPMMKFRLAAPAMLIDLDPIDELRYIHQQNDGVAIGALTTHHMLETSNELHQRAPVVVETAAVIGDVQVRNRGTIGGSLSHADPAADLPAVMLALGAQLVARGPNGERQIPVDEFFVEMLTTALEPDEVLCEVRLPGLQPTTGAAYCKCQQPASGYALVGVAAFVRLDSDRIADARVALTGAAARPYRAQATELTLRGQPATAETLEEAASRATDGQDVQDDLFASPRYRAHLARVYTRRALEAAIARAHS
jgi:carbon-monoxide dehydrogenase medium subunit